MRLLALALLAFLTLAARAAIPLPDTPTVTDLAEFRLTCQSQSATADLMASTGQKEKAAELRARLWERYDAELFARRCALADLSLAALNPFLPAAERKTAAAALPRAVAELAQLSTFTAPDPAARARHLESAGRTVTDAQRSRAQAHGLLQKIRQGIALNNLAHAEAAAHRRDLVARLERTAAAAQPLESLVAEARALPPAAEAVRSLAANLQDDGAVDALFAATGESLALEATLTALIEADPASPALWLARTRARLKYGWRSGAVIDVTLASQFDPAHPRVAAHAAAVKSTPLVGTALWQEWVEPDDTLEILRQRRIAELAGQPAAELAPHLERTARAVIRNRARRLFAATFSGKPEQRQRALAFIGTENSVPPGLFPVVPPALAAQYQAEHAAAGTDAAQHFAIQSRYAPLFGNTEGFWHQHLVLLLGTDNPSAAYAATDIARALFPDAAWVAEARAQSDPVKALPDAEKK